MPQNTCLYGKRPELSQEKSQDNHSLKFFVKKNRFSIFFSTIFFYQFCRQIFLTNIFHEKIILNGHFEGNAYAELKFFQKF